MYRLIPASFALLFTYGIIVSSTDPVTASWSEQLKSTIHESVEDANVCTLADDSIRCLVELPIRHLAPMECRNGYSWCSRSNNAYTSVFFLWEIRRPTPVVIPERRLSAVIHQRKSNLHVALCAGIVQRRVANCIFRVHKRLVVQQMRDRYILSSSPLFEYREVQTTSRRGAWGLPLHVLLHSSLALSPGIHCNAFAG